MFGTPSSEDIKTLVLEHERTIQNYEERLDSIGGREDLEPHEAQLLLVRSQIEFLLLTVRGLKAQKEQELENALDHEKFVKEHPAGEMLYHAVASPAIVIPPARVPPKLTNVLNIESLRTMSLSDLGDVSKTYEVTLTEPDINAIHFACASVNSFAASAGLFNVLNHYGPTLRDLSDRLKKFDD